MKHFRMPSLDSMELNWLAHTVGRTGVVVAKALHSDRVAIVVLAFLVATTGGGYVFLISDRILSRDSMEKEIGAALALDESKIIEDIRSTIQDLPLFDVDQATGTPSDRFE